MAIAGFYIASENFDLTWGKIKDVKRQNKEKKFATQPNNC